MNIFTSETFLDQLIHNQRKAIRYYLFFAVGLVILGIIVIVVAFLSSAWFTAGTPIIPDVFKGLFGTGGAFVSSLSAFQIKEILNRNEKIQTFETIKGQLNALKKNPKSKRDDTEKRLEELMWKVIEKSALN